MEIISVADKRFKKYGKVIKNIDFSSLVEEMKKTEVPEGLYMSHRLSSLRVLRQHRRLRISFSVSFLYRLDTATATTSF